MATQARLSPETHSKVVRLAQETGKTQQEVIDLAVSRYERETFLERLNEDFARLRSDPEEWEKEQEERREWEATLGDGDEG
jgi:predicted transcriptional regulator